MRQPILFDRIFQRAGHMFLANQVIESLRSIFPRKNLVTHARSLSRAGQRRKQKFGKERNRTRF
jgi:hypothetical protein